MATAIFSKSDVSLSFTKKRKNVMAIIIIIKNVKTPPMPTIVINNAFEIIVPSFCYSYAISVKPIFDKIKGKINNRPKNLQTAPSLYHQNKEERCRNPDDKTKVDRGLLFE